MTFFEMEAYKEGEPYPECTVRYATFKGVAEHLSRCVGGLAHLSRVVVYYVGQAHPGSKLIRLSRWQVSSRNLCKFILKNCPFIEE
jgi:hypothetical protein